MYNDNRTEKNFVHRSIELNNQSIDNNRVVISNNNNNNRF